MVNARSFTKRIALAGFSVAATTVAVSAQNELPKVEFEQFTLNNGLRVILSVDSSAPVVATFVHYHVGSKNERSDRTGFAHFFEHLMFEGTANIPRHTIDKLVQSAGGMLNAFTTFDETGYQIQVPKNELKLALWIESERMLHAQVNEVGVETQRAVVKEERKSRLDNQPYGSFLENLAKYIGKGTPYEWTPIGSAQYIDQATIEEFRQFYKDFYLPNNAVLAIVGDIDLKETRNLVEAYFGDIPEGKKVTQPTFKFDKLQLDPEFKDGEHDIVEPQTPLPALIYAWRTVAQGSPDAYPLQVLTTVLAQGESSRLYKTLVDEKQMALQAASFPITLENGGMFAMFSIGRSPDQDINGLATEFDQIVKRVQSEGITEQEFLRARNQIETQYAGGFNSVLEKAQALAQAETFFGDPNHVNTEIDHLMKVTREDVQRVAKTYLTPANRIVLKYLVPNH
ncbi:MAG: insulinase family protein [Ignavibacteriae bacterium]|nr:insulinase family protein [Ignavibacteriota bacterium]MCB9217231.1 insulinase family protein [Ignavibacteria bacterium]